MMIQLHCKCSAGRIDTHSQKQMKKKQNKTNSQLIATKLPRLELDLAANTHTHTRMMTTAAMNGRHDEW